MSRIRRLTVAVCLLAVVALVGASAAEAAPLGTFRWSLGGNSIVLTLRIIQQGAFFQLLGQWDDASLTPFLPVYGVAVVDPNFGIVGNLSRAGFTGETLPGSPFNAWPAGITVQFRLNPLTLSGTWADDRGQTGTMTFLGFAP